ncbi:unnamed protein product [Amoebophrya sp. A25]|nr:unnamed protein product [Amoebophrya sp. A25]|eukprot:GSA25T00003220001.1
MASSSRGPAPVSIQAKSLGRLMKEQKMILEQGKELADLGIYVKWDEDSLTNVKAMIIGPPETPYQYGYYFFDIVFPDNYPYAPPKVQFRTGDKRVRFNPNLYVEGKVCLSILGTWQGPGWTSICNLRSVLITIQSLLSNHPITNEPGHENQTGKKEDVEYNKILGFETVHVAVARMMQTQPPGFEIFKSEMEELFEKNFGNFIDTLKRYDADEGKTTRSPIWSFPVSFETARVRGELEILLKRVRGEEVVVSKTASAKKAQVGVQTESDTKTVPASASKKKSVGSKNDGGTASSKSAASKSASKAGNKGKKVDKEKEKPAPKKKPSSAGTTPGAGPPKKKKKVE